jgi:hypothetical protein
MDRNFILAEILEPNRAIAPPYRKRCISDARKYSPIASGSALICCEGRIFPHGQRPLSRLGFGGIDGSEGCSLPGRVEGLLHLRSQSFYYTTYPCRAGE